jgi:Peptidase A4 family
MSAKDYSSTVQDLSDSMLEIKLADILQDIGLPEEAPPGFDHLSAADGELLKYGLPPPPHREHFPEQYRQWEKIFSQPPRRAPSTIVAAKRSFALPPVQLTLSQTGEDGNSQDSNWCGAINSDLPDGYKFKTVSASWTAPRPCPPSSMKTNSGWDSGTFSADIWIGIDGYETGGPFGYGQRILRAGMTQRCATSVDGAMQTVTIPWISCSPWYRIEISGFFINPGDLVTVTIVDAPVSYASFAPLCTTTVFFYNRSTCTYFSARLGFPHMTSPQYGSAQWIIECSNDSEPDTDQVMPFLGATFFYDCCAFAAKVEESYSGTGNLKTGKETWIKKDLSTAILLDLVQDGAVVSRAVRENDSVLGAFNEKSLGAAMVRSTTVSPRTVVHWQTDASLAPLIYIPLATGKLRPKLYVLVGTIHLGTNADNTFYIHLNNYSPDDNTLKALWEEVKTLQFYGVKVLGRLGGAEDNSFKDLAIPCDGQTDNFEAYYALLQNMIDTHQLDGLDLNVEQSISQDSINRIIDRLSSDYGDEFIITMSPVASDLYSTSGEGNLSGFSYVTLEKTRGKKISWYNAQFYYGGQTMKNTTNYENIISKGVFPPSKLVAGVLTGSGTDAPLTTLETVLPELMKKFPNFGGVAGWEYSGSNPRPVAAPWEWFLTIQDILSTPPS